MTDLFEPGAIFFYLLSATVIVSAIGVAASRNILYSAFALLGTLGGVAGLYLYLGADFVGVVQLLVYVGGILVLILFAILLTNKIGDVKLTNVSTGMMVAAPAAVGLLALAGRIAVTARFPQTESAAAPGTARIGDALLREYLLPFELVSLLLLMALVGAMVLARRAAKEEAQ